VKGLDTNVLLRLLLDDEPQQAQRAIRYVEREFVLAQVWVNRIVLCELIWVLERSYGYRRVDISETVQRLLETDELMVEDAEVVRSALYAYRISGADFSDCLLGMSNGRLGCERTATFDRKAGQLDEFELI
jgi:predicted nucleic-acid-binding protein